MAFDDNMCGKEYVLNVDRNKNTEIVWAGCLVSQINGILYNRSKNAINPMRLETSEDHKLLIVTNSFLLNVTRHKHRIIETNILYVPSDGKK